jgi:hypothetical protein
MVYPREKTQSATRDVWVVVSNQGAAEEERQRKSGRGRAEEEERKRKSGRGRGRPLAQCHETLPAPQTASTRASGCCRAALAVSLASRLRSEQCQGAPQGHRAAAGWWNSSPTVPPDPPMDSQARPLIPSRFPHFFDVSFSTNFVRNSHDCHQADVRYQVRAMRAERVARAKSSYTRGPTREIPALLPSAINRRGTAMFCREN